MTQFFYLENGEKRGPFSIEELGNQNISRNTMVWFHPMPDWKPAGQLRELQHLFTLEPPEERTYSSTTHQSHQTPFPGERPPKSWLVESILVTFFCCLPFGIAGIVNAANVESRFYRGDVEGAKRSSEEAGKWTKVAFWLGIAGYSLYIVFIIFTAVVSN